MNAVQNLPGLIPFHYRFSFFLKEKLIIDLQLDIHGTFRNHTLYILYPTLYSTLDNNCKNLSPVYRPLFEYIFNEIQVMFYSRV